MIARTKVNYRLSELLQAFMVHENIHTKRQSLVYQLGKLFNTQNILLTASGRGALYILLSSLPQPRILIPAYTCKAVVEAAYLAQKEILYGETEENGFNMTVDSLKGMLNADTILLATHQFGFPCDIRSMIQCAKEAGSFVIEDAAASLGSRVDGQLTGTFGDAAFFSFDSTKLVNVPLKAGFLIVKDSEIFTRCKIFFDSHTSPMSFERKLYYFFLGVALVMLEKPILYRLFHNIKFHWRGRYTDDSADFKPIIGPFYQDRLSEWQATLLLPQIDQIIATRRRLYSSYCTLLKNVKSFSLPPADSNGEWALIRFPIRIHRDKLNFYRKATQLGVDFAFSFTFIESPFDFILSHKLAASVLDIPFYNRLTDKEVKKVVSVLCDIDKTISTGA